MSRSFIPDRGPIAAADRPQPDLVSGQEPIPEPASTTPAPVRALDDATVPEADNDEALAAAVALWHVVVQTERV